LRTLDDVRSREDERLEEARRAVIDYQNIVNRFKQDISKEVQQYHLNIVNDVETKLQEALDSEERKEQREQEMVEELRAKIEREFSEQFEHRFNLLEDQLAKKNQMLQEAQERVENMIKSN
jgi:hypothetical protein